MFRSAASAGAISAPHSLGQQSAAALLPVAVALPLTGALPLVTAITMTLAVAMSQAVVLPQAAASGKARIMILKTKLQPAAQA